VVERVERIDAYATALFPYRTVDDLSEIGPSYTPLLGPFRDAVHRAAQARVNVTTAAVPVAEPPRV
jgi:hypothetical protein